MKEKWKKVLKNNELIVSTHFFYNKIYKKVAIKEILESKSNIG